jgi:hypothetical protein
MLEMYRYDKDVRQKVRLISNGIVAKELRELDFVTEEWLDVFARGSLRDADLGKANMW